MSDFFKKVQDDVFTEMVKIKLKKGKSVEEIKDEMEILTFEDVQSYIEKLTVLTDREKLLIKTLKLLNQGKTVEEVMEETGLDEETVRYGKKAFGNGDE